MRRVALAELVRLLDRHPGAAIVTMVVRTEPRLLVKSRLDGTPTPERFPHGIEKLGLGRFMLANRYQANVREQRRREAHPRPRAFRSGKLWSGHGERIGRFLARHTEHDRLYLVARPQSDSYGNPAKLWERWIDLARGCDLAGDELDDVKQNYLRDLPAESKKQELRRRIPYRTYHVVSVHSVTIGGQVYRVEPDRSAFVCDAG